MRLIENDRINPLFMAVTGGPVSGMLAVMTNMVLDVLREDYPSHWKMIDILSDPDWEDWRDFLQLATKEDQE